MSFAYPGGRRDAHRGSVSASRRERVGFVGESGAGKSTIVRLLLRFFDPDAGVVRVGGHDLRSLRADDVYANVAVVNQDTYLFHGTVEDNLRFGKADATAEELESAARAANAHEFITRLPDGYATVIGERGIRLSAGSASASRSPAPCSATRRSWSSTRRSRRWTPRTRRSSSPRSTG